MAIFPAIGIALLFTIALEDESAQPDAAAISAAA